LHSNENVLNTSSHHRGERLCRRTEAPRIPINLSSWCHCSTHLSSLVGILFYNKFVSNCFLSSSGAIVHLFSHRVRRKLPKTSDSSLPLTRRPPTRLNHPNFAANPPHPSSEPDVRNMRNNRKPNRNNVRDFLRGSNPKYLL